MSGSPQTPELRRSFGLLQATAMNMSNMVGVGPFLTIPLILAAMGGPQAMLGWILGALLAICDGMVWAELASAVPSSGGTFEYLKQAYAGTRLGRLLPFLFIWQFILSGPLEIASGNIGFVQYLEYLAPLDPRVRPWLAAGLGAVAVVLLYRKIEWVGMLMVALWAGVIVTLAAVLLPGLWHFDAGAVFSFPPDAFTFSQGFLLGLGSAMLWAMYDFLGYYSVCYIGDEVKSASRTIPRAILLSVLVVAAIYLVMNVSIISVVPWQEAMRSEHIASLFMERLAGPLGGKLMTVLICWTAFASVFALMLGYSRIPYAAARDGFFFSVFARLHPRGGFPHVSLLVLGAVTIGAGFFSLDNVIKALISTRILVQFVAQIGAVVMLRRRGIRVSMFRMALYPLPAIIALAGWVYIFAASGNVYILAGLGTLLAGVVAYGIWQLWSRSRRVAIVVIVVLAVIAIIAAGIVWRTCSGSSEEPQQAARPIYEVLDELTSVDFEGVPLDRAMEEIGKRHAIRIVIDAKGLDDAGLKPDLPVTLHVTGITLRSALDLLTHSVYLDWSTQSGSLLISTPDEAGKVLETRRHLVRDLIASPSYMKRPGDQDLDYDLLADIVVSMVGPTTWDAGTGSGTAWVTPDRGAFVFSQTPRIHDECEDLFIALRRAIRERAAIVRPGPPNKLYHEERIRQALEEMTETNAARTPIAEVLATFERRHGVPIHVDQTMLSDRKLSMATPVSLQAADLSLKSALQRVLQQLGLVAVVHHEVIFVTHNESVPAEIVIYRIADLWVGGRENREAVIKLLDQEMPKGHDFTHSLFGNANLLVCAGTAESQEQVLALLNKIRGNRASRQTKP